MLNRNFDNRAAVSEQEFSDFRKGLAFHRLIVHGNDTIAKPQTSAVSRCFFKGGANIRINIVAFTQVTDGRADAKIFGSLFSPESGVVSGVEISRVRIEHIQHAADRRLKDRVVIKFLAVDVVVLNYRKRF